uniref:cDNA sequence BC034090 n=1 Tax=Jaculus jaculus TaxID=51337 RepID=A0A8C5LG14_JACJA
MEGMEAAAQPARGGPGSKTGRTASPMEVTSAKERNGPEPQPDNGPLPTPWLCSGEDQTPSLMPSQPPKARFRGPSVLESKVKALKEKMTAHKHGAKPCPTSPEHASSKESRCQRAKGFPQPGAMVVPYSQNLTDGQLGYNISEEEPARNGNFSPPRLPSWNGQSPWPPEAKSPLPGPGSLQESPTHPPTAGQPQGPKLWKNTHMSSLKTGTSYPLQDGLVIGRDLDNTVLTSKENLVPRTALLEALWRAGNPGAPGTRNSVLSLSDRVERNRLVLQEILKISGQSPPKVGSPPWTPSWDRAAPEQLAEDVDWDSDTPLQDTGQGRARGPKPEPVLRVGHEEAKHLLQRARMKARTQPLRANHDIVPTITQGSRDGRRSPHMDARMTSASTDSLQNGNLRDSSSGESSNGQGPKRAPPLSHVRFEDESACEAEVRCLERLQQRQRQMLSVVMQAVGQGPLCSKPDVTNYINRDLGARASNRPLCCVDGSSLSASSLAWGSKRKCQACGTCLEECHPSEGKATLDPRVFQGSQVARGAETGLRDSYSSHSLGIPFPLLPAEPGLHVGSIRETHIGDTVVTCPEEGDSGLDTTDTSDSYRTDSEEARTSQPSRAGRQTRGSSSLRQRHQGCQPQGGRRPARKGDRELPCSLQAKPHLPGSDDGEPGEGLKGGRGHRAQETWFLREDAVQKTPASEPKSSSLASQKQCGPELGNQRDRSGASCAPRTTAGAALSSMTPAPLGSGRPENRDSAHTGCASSVQMGRAEPSASHQVQQPASPLSPEGWIPTPPSSRKSACPVPHRERAQTGYHRRGHQAEPAGIPLPLSPARTPQPCSPCARHPLPDLSTTRCISLAPLGMQESWGVAVHKGRVERDPCCQEVGPPLEIGRTFQDCLGSADAATVNSTAITLSLASEEPEAIQESSGSLQRAESSSGGHMPPRASLGARPASAAPSDERKKRTSNIASTLGLKKLFSALGHTSRPKMGTSRSYSVEQLQCVAPGPASHTSILKEKRAPSLQFLHLVSPSHQHRKAASFQNLHSLLSGKGDRSSLYLVESPGDPRAPGRPARTPPRRTLSVEDVGAPSLARTVGRVVEVFPDGTSQLQLQRPPEGTFGFRVAYGNGHRDSGLYVQAMADLDTAKLYSGLLGVGDEILEVNGAKVAGLGLAHIKELLARVDSLSVRVLRHRPAPQ